jgi:hydroxylamine reductase
MQNHRSLWKKRSNCKFARYNRICPKRVAAYRTHAHQLGYTDPFVDAITHEALYMTLTNVNFNEQEHFEMAMKVGQAAVRVMELLDRAHTERFGIPNPVRVSQKK